MRIFVKKGQKITYKLGILFVKGGKAVSKLFLLEHRAFDFAIAIFSVGVLFFKSSISLQNFILFR